MIAQQRLANFGFILQSEGISEADHSKLQSLGIELKQLYSKSLSQARAIDSDETFTSKGKLIQKRKLADEIAQDLTKFDKLLTKEMTFVDGESWALELRKLKESMHSSTQPKLDPVLVELQHQECRRYLLELDPAEREAVIKRATTRNDYSLLDAALSGPRLSTEYLLDITRKSLEESRIKAMNPAASARIAQIERAQRTLSGMVSSLKQSLTKQGLFEEPEKPIHTVHQPS